VLLIVKVAKTPERALPPLPASGSNMITDMMEEKIRRSPEEISIFVKLLGESTKAMVEN
jgi:hypothetical protein